LVLFLRCRNSQVAIAQLVERGWCWGVVVGGGGGWLVVAVG